MKTHEKEVLSKIINREHVALNKPIVKRDDRFHCQNFKDGECTLSGKYFAFGDKKECNISDTSAVYQCGLCEV